MAYCGTTVNVKLQDVEGDGLCFLCCMFGASKLLKGVGRE